MHSIPWTRYGEAPLQTIYIQTHIYLFRSFVNLMPYLYVNYSSFEDIFYVPTKDVWTDRRNVKFLLLLMWHRKKQKWQYQYHQSLHNSSHPLNMDNYTPWSYLDLPKLHVLQCQVDSFQVRYGNSFEKIDIIFKDFTKTNQKEGEFFATTTTKKTYSLGTQKYNWKKQKKKNLFPQ